MDFGKNVLLSKCYKLVLFSRNAFFGDNTVALGQSGQDYTELQEEGSGSGEGRQQGRQGRGWSLQEDLARGRQDPGPQGIVK